MNGLYPLRKGLRPGEVGVGGLAAVAGQPLFLPYSTRNSNSFMGLGFVLSEVVEVFNEQD
jgi:hypothetical protein